MSIVVNSTDFRRVLGHYPTGVCAVTTISAGHPVGMIVGSFTSVSLDPPLVSFLPDRKSNTWRLIEAAGRFCVNVLSERQLPICRALSSRGENKFDTLSYRLSATGLPVLNDIVVWIECDLFAVHEAGDHYIAIGKVQALDIEHPHLPLVFLQGGYGSFSVFPAET